MGQKLPPNEMELYRRTDEILHYVWDPIGIAGVPEARDEYHSYLPGIFAHLLKSDADAIRRDLKSIAEDRMGLKADLERIDHVAGLLLRSKEVCL